MAARECSYESLLGIDIRRIAEISRCRKILARASGAAQVKPGDLVVVGVDTVVLYDGNFFPAYWRASGREGLIEARAQAGRFATGPQVSELALAQRVRSPLIRSIHFSGHGHAD